MDDDRRAKGARMLARGIALAVAWCGFRLMVLAAGDARIRAGNVLAIALHGAMGTAFVIAAWRGWASRTAAAVRWVCIAAWLELYVLCFSGIDAVFIHATGWGIADSPTGNSDLTRELVPDFFFLMLAVMAMFACRATSDWLASRLRLVDSRPAAQRRRWRIASIGAATFLIVVAGADAVRWLDSPVFARGGWGDLGPSSALLAVFVAANVAREKWGARPARATPE